MSVNQECKITDGDAVIIHDDKNSHELWLVAKVEKVLLPKDYKARGETIKYFTNGKTFVTKNTDNKLYPIEPMKQTSENSTNFFDYKKICQTETL